MGELRRLEPGSSGKMTDLRRSEMPDMLLAALSLFTLLTVAGLALWSKKRTEARMESDAKKSTLAKDAPNH